MSSDESTGSENASESSDAAASGDASSSNDASAGGDTTGGDAAAGGDGRVGLDLQRLWWERAADYLGRASLVPEQAGRMAGVDVGTTPSEVVYRENKLRLLHYEPRTDEQHETPVLVVYALINRPYILDLQPDRSVVRSLLDEGFDVYLIDWGEPSRLDASLTLTDYVNRYVDNCVDVVREETGVDRVTLLGYCMGGTMSAMYTALHPEKVRNLALLAAGMHFEDTGGLLEQWGEGDFYDPTAVTDAFGNVPSEFLDTGFALMDPVENYLTKYVRLYDGIEDDDLVENFARMETWLADGIDVAGATYEQFIEDIYQDNKLMRNELELDGERVDLANIEVPVLQIVGSYDHLIPPESSTPFNDAVASEDTEVMEFPSGHIGLSVSGRSHDQLWPSVAEWLAERSGPLRRAAAVEPTAATAREAADEGVSAATAEASGVGVEAAAEDLEAVDGVGSAYAERLREAGIRDLRALAGADAGALAAEVGVGEARVRSWVVQADELVGE